MVGNLNEWVEDWIQDNTDVDGGFTSSALYGGDTIFGVDEANSELDRFPAAIFRGGEFFSFGGSPAGVFTLAANIAPSGSNSDIGFRCAR